jgi:hypothetical protein
MRSANALANYGWHEADIDVIDADLGLSGAAASHRACWPRRSVANWRCSFQLAFVRDPSSVVTKDPNREVQERIALLFECFLSVRTAVKATRILAARGLALPRRDRHGEVCRRRPTISAVTDMPKNPSYAGAFVYGRTRLQPSSLPGRPSHKSPRPAVDWRIVVKDKYPAYISLGTFEKIQAMLRDNRASICASRAVAPRVTARHCCMASP